MARDREIPAPGVKKAPFELGFERNACIALLAQEEKGNPGRRKGWEAKVGKYETGWFVQHIVKQGEETEGCLLMT